ncbi:hypothetical protein Q1695_002472 [Nippostrongylus brasiliensis]|nr:hypothetical protein Q1695_002472 [Nippostrongylus brasiliensis]
MDSAPKVKLICGIFLSLSIVSTVLACALWDFPAQTPANNILYFNGLLLAFMLNSGIAYCLMIGTVHQNSRMFFPYIVCASIYSAVSVFGIAFFFGSLLYALSSSRMAGEVYGLAVFTLLFGFWYWSLQIVRSHRDYVRKTSGEHVKFNNPEFV